MDARYLRDGQFPSHIRRFDQGHACTKTGIGIPVLVPPL
jgi:hypothetical protein